MRPSPLRRLVLLLLLLAAAGCGRDAPAAGDAAGAPAPDHPRFAGSLDPGYVGDGACAACHAEVVESYRATNHGRSLTRFDPAGAPERFGRGEGAWVHSRPDGLRYLAELRGGALVQREVRLGEDGAPTQEMALAADLVIGSGHQTRSYLLDTGGRLTEMPLTWYARRRAWDLSPGYQEANDRFGRPIILQCLACHSDRPVREPHTQNVYRGLPGPISCERCHGPAREHVQRRAAGEAPAAGAADPWIVTPTRLPREREMAVCAQCHLAGVIAYPDREDPTTFRPGMRLEENRAVFVPALQLEDPEWVGIDSHPIRLARSACFQATEMTCSTCHAPHTAGSRLGSDHYRARCLSCHTGAAAAPAARLCSRPGASTPEQARSGDCASCHMSAGGTSDVPHVRFTDHWIRRRPGPALDPSAGRPVIESREPLRLAEVGALGRAVRGEEVAHRTPALRASLRADALFHFYETMHRHPDYPRQVIALGREAEAGRGSAEGRLALARSLLDADSVAAAEEVLKRAVADRPDDPWGHLLLGALLQERRYAPDAALPHLRRAVELQPRLHEARAKLAEGLLAAGRAGEAAAELERLVGQDTVHSAGSWFNLGMVRLRLGDAAGAERAFREAARLDPTRAAPWVQLGALRIKAGDAREGERALRAAVAADPRDAAAQGTLAVALLQAGRVEEGRARLRRVLEIDPANAAARALLEQFPER